MELRDRHMSNRGVIVLVFMLMSFEIVYTSQGPPHNTSDRIEEASHLLDALVGTAPWKRRLSSYSIRITYSSKKIGIVCPQVFRAPPVLYLVCPLALLQRGRENRCPSRYFEHRHDVQLYNILSRVPLMGSRQNIGLSGIIVSTAGLPFRVSLQR